MSFLGLRLQTGSVEAQSVTVRGALRADSLIITGSAQLPAPWTTVTSGGGDSAANVDDEVSLRFVDPAGLRLELAASTVSSDDYVGGGRSMLLAPDATIVATPIIPEGGGGTFSSGVFIGSGLTLSSAAQSVVVGAGAADFWSGDVVLGAGAMASASAYENDTDNIVIGHNAIVQGTEVLGAIGIGPRINVGPNAAYSVAMGADIAMSAAPSAVAIGVGANVHSTATAAAAIGPYASVRQMSDRSVAIGNGTSIFGTCSDSIAIGPSTAVYFNASSAVAIGASARVFADTGESSFGSIAMGPYTVVRSSEFATALGGFNTASISNSTGILGHLNTVRRVELGTFIGGFNSTAISANSVARDNYVRSGIFAFGRSIEIAEPVTTVSGGNRNVMVFGTNLRIGTFSGSGGTDLAQYVPNAFYFGHGENASVEPEYGPCTVTNMVMVQPLPDFASIEAAAASSLPNGTLYTLSGSEAVYVIRRLPA